MSKTVSACCGAGVKESLIHPGGFTCNKCHKNCIPTNPPTEIVSDCCGEKAEYNHAITNMLPGWHCLECGKKCDINPSTEPTKKINCCDKCRSWSMKFKSDVYPCHNTDCECHVKVKPTVEKLDKATQLVNDWWVNEGWRANKLIDLEGLIKEINKLQSHSVQEAKAERAREIIHLLDDLEHRQPEDLKTDNWRNWKYIRNSIVDKYDLLTSLRKERGEE